MNSRILKDKEVSSLSMQECEILEKGMMQEKSMCRFCGFCNNKKKLKGDEKSEGKDREGEKKNGKGQMWRRKMPKEREKEFERQELKQRMKRESEEREK